MDWEYLAYMAPLLAATVGSAVLAAFLWRRRPAPGARAATVLMLAVMQWSFFYLLELGTVGREIQLLWLRLEYLGIVTVSVAWVAFALDYTGRRKWLTPRNLALLSILPLVTLLMVWTNESHGLYYQQVSLGQSGPFTVLVLTFGPWYWVHILYAYTLLLLGTGILIRFIFESKRMYRRQAALLLLGALAPWAASAVYLLKLLPLPNVDLTPFAFALSGLALALAISRFRLFDVVPVAREAVVESMSDGLIVLDLQDHIVDLNPVAQRIIGCQGREAIGRPADQVLSHRPDMLKTLRASEEAQAEVALDDGAARRHYDMSISPLYDRRQRMAGRLVVFRDVTERKRSEQALRKEWDRAQRYLDVAEVMLVALNRKGEITLINRKGCRILGYGGGELLGRDWFATCLPASAREDAKQVLQRLMAGEIESVEYYENPVLTRSGEEKIIAWHNSILMDEAGSAIGILSSGEDITDRKRAEEALRESEARYHSLFDRLPVGLYRTSPEGQIFDVNPALVEMMGYPDREALLAINAAEVYSNPEDRARVQALLEREGIVRHFEVQMRRHGGSPIWVRDTVTAIHDDEGRVLYYEGSLEDITERKRAEEERERLIAELQEALAKVKTLSGLLPICASCKKIRDDQGYWREVELYIGEHSTAEFTHGLCPECAKRLYPRFYADPQDEGGEGPAGV